MSFSVLPPAPTAPATAAQSLAEVLAEVVGTERVSPDAHFFDDLGADSMLMARFCARVRKRPDLPSVSMKDVYHHPTIAGLAIAFAGSAPAPVEPSVAPPVEAMPVAEAPPQVETATRDETGAAGRAQYILCGTLQLLFFLCYSYLSALVLTWGYEWVWAGSGLLDMYERAVVFGAATFLGACLLPVLAKWLLIGRWKPRRIPIWSLAYVRFWLVKSLVRSNPLLLVAGGRSHTSGSSPLYVLYLRALGGKIGRNVAIYSRNMPLCTDLLTIGDGSVIRKDAIFPGYRAHAGVIHIGSVTLGDDVFVGEVTVLDIGTVMGDGSQLGHASSLHTGQVVPAGERWHGSPAQRADVDYQVVTPTPYGTLRKVTFAASQLLTALLVYLPLAIGGTGVILAGFPMLQGLFDTSGLAFTTWTFYHDALVISVVVFVGGLLVGLLVAMGVPRVFNLAIRPGRVYPLYGFHYSIHRMIGRLTNVKFFTTLFGDSSYIVYYLRGLGYDLSKVEQTGSNFGTDMRHETPFHVTVGRGTMVADGLSLINADFSNNAFRVSRTSIGARNFLGNNIAYTAQSRTGDNCLLATKCLVPVDGDVREGVGLLGSPSFEIPRSVDRDTALGLGRGDELHRRLVAKNRYNLASMGLFLLARWIHVFGVTVLGLAAADYYRLFGPTAVAAELLALTVFTMTYFVLVERAATGFRALRPQTCSIYDPYFWWHERYWKLVIPPFDLMLAGTPFKNVVSRLLGVRLGSRVFDDGCAWPERTLITIGDQCTLNAGSTIQCHSQEDGAFKSDRVTIAAGCTLGLNALVHYGVTIGEGVEIDSDSFVMKGSEIPARARWSGNPAGETLATGAVTPLVRETPAAVASPAAQRPSPTRRTHPVPPVPAERPSPTRRTHSIPPVPAERPSPTRRTHPVPPVPRDDHVRRPRRRTVTTPATDPSDAPAEPGRTFWQGALAAGGGTTLRRWTLDPAPGVAEHEAPIPRETVVAARRLAYDLGVPLRSLLLAAHARVLAALSGERDVVVGYLAHPVVRPLPCLLSTEPASWRALVEKTRRAESALRAYAGFPVDDLRRELGVSSPSYETVFDPAGAGEVSGDTVLYVGFPEQDGRRTLRLRYRTDVMDAACAARTAGYHLTALAQILADPDAEHRRQSLLSADELRLQLDGFAGPARELPARRAHELFEQQVAAHRGAVAAVHGDRRLTYRALNSRANRVARALRAHGLRREGVVAVVTERNLDWMASVIAVFKAGGVYLPVEPHFPADRIAATLSRAACQLVLTEPGSTASLDRALDALPGVQKLLVDDAYGEGHADTDLGVDVAADQLAYIYFTSGSTGEPKGAMCEHAGMLNHLLAKIEDLGIGQGQVVAQTAPQCFDISLWQLFSALLVGGQTLLVEQEAVLDVERFVDIVDEGRVAVLQVVPSYLEAVLAYLEQHPRPLPHLQVVSATGEALKKELVQRWFAARPGIPLVNAYGLTETSDDTNHEVMRDVPDLDRVPLGRPVRNALVSVVDEHLSPVPLGAPGEIVFSGVCVGRGYVNDPERTRAAFTTDPHRPGARLYRSGDHGRWLPDGRLEYLGRRDSQVKISGFRIEIGEIENTLLRLPGVRDTAVVVAERADGNRRLVAFHAGQPLDADILTARLAQALPAYMVPSTFHHRRDGLPVTGNGKIDRKVLTALAAELDAVDGVDGDGDAPATPTEQRLAAAWAEVLGVPRDQVGRGDHFFDRGGTSLTAVKLAVALDRAVSPKDLLQTPVLADLAELLDGRQARTANAARLPL